MICCNCGRELSAGTRFCIHCGAEQPPVTYAQETPARPASQYTAYAGSTTKKPKGKCLLFGACGTVIGAALLAVILFIAGVFSFAGKTVEGPGFATPEDAANAYLNGLRDRDFDAMLSSFAIETYVSNYDLESFIERINAYGFNFEIRFPNSNDYTKRLNIEARKVSITNQIFYQFVYHNAPDALNDGAITGFDSPEDISDFIADFERDTKDYVFEDLKVLTAVSSLDLKEGSSPEELAEDLLEDVEDELPKGLLKRLLEVYTNENNQKAIERQAKAYGASLEDIANLAVVFEADGNTWVFCPQAIRYNGRWYLQSLQGNLASLYGMSVFTGGIMPVD